METYRILLELSIIVVTAKFFGTTVKKLGAPEVAGEIIAGLLIGPTCFDLVKADQFVTYMAEIGVILLMFSAGIETNLNKLLKTGGKAVLIAGAGVVVPFVFGAAAALAFWGFDGIGTEKFLRALFIGAVLTATSVSITAAVLQELGKITTDAGTAIMSAAIIDDVMGILVLTAVLGMSTGNGGYAIIILKIASFPVAAAIIGYITYRAFKWYDSRHPHSRRISIYGIGIAFMYAYLAERVFGIADITGAYVAGVILSSISDADYIEQKVETNSYMLFAPVFFASIGLKTTVRGMDWSLLGFSLAFVAAGLFGKILGCGLTSRLLGFTRRESLQIGFGMMTRGEVALIVAQKGLDAGMIDPKYFTSVILLIIISSVIVPVLLKKLFEEKPHGGTGIKKARPV